MSPSQNPARWLRDVVSDESGATSIEYALIGGLMALVCVASFSRLGTIVAALYAISQTLVAAALGP